MDGRRGARYLPHTFAQLRSPIPCARDGRRSYATRSQSNTTISSCRIPPYTRRRDMPQNMVAAKILSDCLRFGNSSFNIVRERPRGGVATRKGAHLHSLVRIQARPPQSIDEQSAGRMSTVGFVVFDANCTSPRGLRELDDIPAFVARC